MDKNQDDTRKKECERVDGTWFKYFYKVADERDSRDVQSHH